MRSELVASWLLTLTLHAGILIVIAWFIDRGALRARLAWREWLWRVALFGAVVSATAQILIDLPSPARFALPVTDTAQTGSAPSDATMPAFAPHLPASSRQVYPAQDTMPGVASAPKTYKGRSSAIARTQLDATADIQPRHLSWKVSWQNVLVAGWLAGALIALARVLFKWRHIGREIAGAQPLDDSVSAADAAAFAIHARVALPQLAALDDLASPIALPGGCIILPRWALELLDRQQVRAMLAHEIAHLARRDPAWKLATALWCALLWFLPLAVVRRRLDEIAELACDAWAAHHLGDGRSLAECLAECAGQHGEFESDLVAAMAHRDSPLLQRIDQLIGGVPLNTNCSRICTGAASILVLTLAVFVMPGFTSKVAHAQYAGAPPTPPPAPSPPAPPTAPVAATTAPARGTGYHVHISSDTGLSGSKSEFTSVSISHNGHGYNAKIDGKVTFNTDETDIATLSDGGSASFGETQGGSTRRVDYASSDGRIERHYFVDGREQPVDAAAQRWIAGIIAVVIREAAIDAEARVKRIHANGGAGAVLDEIGRIDSGYARGVYLKQLAKLGKLSDAQMTRAIGLVDGIDSDYERRNALVALAAVQPFDPEQQKLVLAQAGKIDSDYERAELLVAMMPTLAHDPSVRAAWLRAASGIGSDYEHRRVLSALLTSGPLDDVTLAQIIGAAKSIDSDYERRELLVGAIKNIGDADRVAQTYVTAAADIGSDYERRTALLALIAAPRFGVAGARAVLDATNGMGSDYETREVLVALAREMPNDADLIARYRAVARKLSDHERGQAERALDRLVD
ncbi:MAG: M56 family metallopeptidase [Rhodanobacteraceae bacterium]